MVMSIEDSILYMELYKRSLTNSVSDLTKDIEAYNIAINTMQKYQRIKKWFRVYKTDIDRANEAILHIAEELEDGNY